MTKKKASKKKAAPKGAYKPGRRLEKLVEMIELQAQSREGVTVESPKYIPDKDTGALREFDVVVTIKVAHHEPIMLALECRDRSRPVGAPDVEQFAAKCRGAGVHQGIIVSARGFAETARKKAKAHNIGCFELAQAERFGWCDAPGIFGYERTVRHMQITRVDVDETRGVPKPPITLLESGILDIGLDELQKIAASLVMNVPVKYEVLSTFPPGTIFKESMNDPDPNFALVDADGRAFRVTYIGLDLYFEIKSVFTPLQFHTYSDSSGKLVSETASADITINGQAMTIAIVGEPDGPKRVMISSVNPAGDKKPTRRKRRK